LRFKYFLMKKLCILFSTVFCVAQFAIAQQDGNPVIYLWPNGAPGFENKKDLPEEAKDYWLKSVNNPSLTVYPAPKEKATGAAVIICPGGGHRLLVITSEGKEAAEYFNSIGITAFVLKYRLFREENSVYTVENTLQDGRRAMRMVRQQAANYNIDTNKIGIIGFSAGGELAAWVALDNPKEQLVKTDAVDNKSCIPNFCVLIYPGPLAVPADSLAGNTPPLFMAAANDDACCSDPILKITSLYRKAHAKVEMHLFAQGNHAFNMGKRSALKSINAWPQRMADWLQDSGITTGR
jgi:acetyl esterase/lipase